MGGYYLAPSLETLRAEINARWPRRDKASDGWIGDPAHQATRSDHNPNDRGSVDALDIDEDGLDFATVFDAIKRHPSSRYVIYERRLYHRLRGWRSEPYSGVNPHDKHFHLSIDQTRAAEQDRRPWGLLEDDMPLTAADKALVRDAVLEALQTKLPLPGAIGERMAKLGSSYGPSIAPWTLFARIFEPAVRQSLAVGQGVDVDEAELAVELAPHLLAQLTPERIAAAIPPALARQVADELAARLQG